ncbi:MAG TPA: hypothetical protein VJ755_03435 [Gemmatimonadales bacterium]|nr:hypothetical protein [Gemmatimonadales bacterium]
MPPLSRWYIKSAMIYLVAGLFVGAVGALQQPLHLPQLFALTGPAYVHMLVVGWITQMIFGVAYWMFPKYTTEMPRGNNVIAIATFALLNVGLLLRVVVEPVRAWRPEALPGWLLAAAGLAQALAAVGFTLNTWPRVKAR